MSVLRSVIVFGMVLALIGSTASAKGRRKKGKYYFISLYYLLFYIFKQQCISLSCLKMHDIRPLSLSVLVCPILRKCDMKGLAAKQPKSLLRVFRRVKKPILTKIKQIAFV